MPPRVQDHHIIPKEWRNHPSVQRYGMDINERKNIMLMPTNYGMTTMNLRETRYIHEGGHHSYNKFVKKYLDSIKSIEHQETFEETFRDFHTFLKTSLTRGNTYIPWL